MLTEKWKNWIFLKKKIQKVNFHKQLFYFNKQISSTNYTYKNIGFNKTVKIAFFMKFYIKKVNLDTSAFYLYTTSKQSGKFPDNLKVFQISQRNPQFQLEILQFICCWKLKGQLESFYTIWKVSNKPENIQTSWKSLT